MEDLWTEAQDLVSDLEVVQGEYYRAKGAYERACIDATRYEQFHFEVALVPLMFTCGEGLRSVIPSGYFVFDCSTCCCYSAVISSLLDERNKARENAAAATEHGSGGPTRNVPLSADTPNKAVGMATSPSKEVS